MAQSDRDEAAPAAALEATAHGQSAPDSVAAWKGRVLDERYLVTRLLGEGGMGAVYVAEHLTLRKEVALKVIRAELVGNSEVATRFAREALATAQFEHPHVASAIDYGTLPEGGAYFVMQLVRGRSLRHLLSGHRKLPWRRACLLAAQVADALSAAKAAGIIHRDLKPDNILVEQREDGSDLVKVLDFGIAHVSLRDAPAPEGAMADRQLTRVGTVMGTPGYMPPEQAVGDTVDHRADLYALGVVLWECIAGRELWQAPDLTAIITMQMSQPVPLLREEVDLEIPAKLDALVQKLTAREPNTRPEHAGAVRDELQGLAHAVGGARPTLPLMPMLREAVVPAVSTVVSRFRTQPRRRQQQLAGGGALLLTVLLAVLLGGDDTAARGASEGTEPAEAAQAATATENDGQGQDQDQRAERDTTVDTQRDSSQEAPPSALQKVVDAVEPVVEAAMAGLPGAGPSLPDALSGPVETMQHGDTLRARRRAARRILAHEPRGEVPVQLRHIASLTVARSCKTRRTAIETMASSPHPDYLEPLWRMRRAPKSGCGFLSLSDCYGCVRPKLRTAINKIGKVYPDANEAARE